MVNVQIFKPQALGSPLLSTPGVSGVGWAAHSGIWHIYFCKCAMCVRPQYMGSVDHNFYKQSPLTKADDVVIRGDAGWGALHKITISNNSACMMMSLV